MSLHMCASDVVICRAGAMTLTEIAQMGKSSILIPSPNVTDNHQYKNAKVLADAGAAILLEEKDLTEESIQSAVETLAENEEARRAMETNVAAFASVHAGKRIYEDIQALLERTRDRKRKY